MKKKIPLFLFLSFSLGQTLLFESFNIDDIEDVNEDDPEDEEFENQVN